MLVHASQWSSCEGVRVACGLFEEVGVGDFANNLQYMFFMILTERGLHEICDYAAWCTPFLTLVGVK